MDEKHEKWTVCSSELGQRLDLCLVEKLPELSRAKVQKLIRQGHVLVQGQPTKSNYVIRDGDEIQVTIKAEPSPLSLNPHPMDLDILFEDDCLIVLNKPTGISVHPGAGEREPTLVEGILAHLSDNSPQKSLRPGVVHRLDKDTTGVLVFAKDEQSHAHLAKQFEAKTNHREYIALLDGYMEEETLDYESYLFRDPKERLRFASIRKEDYEKKYSSSPEDKKGYRFASSHFEKLQSYAQRFTLASITLRTGRTHQIRVHCKALKHPVLGDPLYNTPHEFPKTIPQKLTKTLKSLKRQMLHAKILSFTHPKTGERMSFEAPLPEDFEAVLKTLECLKDR